MSRGNDQRVRRILELFELATTHTHGSAGWFMNAVCGVDELFFCDWEHREVRDMLIAFLNGCPERQLNRMLADAEEETRDNDRYREEDDEQDQPRAK